MNKAWMVLAFSMAVPALATNYTVPAGSSSSSIQAIVNTAGAAPAIRLSSQPAPTACQTRLSSRVLTESFIPVQLWALRPSPIAAPAS